MEAAFVDIGLERNGFLHVDEIVTPDGKAVPKRGRGQGRRIDELIKRGQEIVVQVVKDPLKTKGARLSMQLSIAGRYLVYMPQGGGIGVSRRLPDGERSQMRKNLEKLHAASKEKGGYIVRTAAQGANKEDFEREIAYLHKLHEVARAALRGRRGAVADLPGGRPADPRPPRRPRQRVRRRRDRRPEAVRAGDLVLPADRAGAGRLGRDALALRAPVRASRRRGGVPLDALAPGRSALRRLPDHRLRRGADGDRHQHRQLHRQGQGPARGHDHEGQRRGRRRGRPPAPAPRHRRDHRHRLHRHGAGARTATRS